MKLKLASTFVVCALSVVLFACSPAPKATITVTCDDFAKQQNIVASADTPFTVGKSFTVSLCSDPSTGLQWQESATINDQTVVQQTAHKRMSGRDVWTFKALSEGHALLFMESTSSSPGADGGQRTFRLTVAVQ